MGEFYIDSAIATGSLLILALWIWRRYAIPLSRQIELVFFIGGSLISIGVGCGTVR